MFSLVMFSQTYDVTISGLVTDENTGEFIPRQEMIITTDSSSGSGFFYYNIVITDNYGFFTDVMQVPTGVEGVVYVSTIACNNFVSQSSTFSDPTTELVFDFEICSESGGDLCQAMFYYYPGEDPLSIQFTDISVGDPTLWAWDFGDGETSNQQNPEHTYAESGLFSTTLTISSQDSSCSSTYDMMVRVGGNDTITDCQAFFDYYQGNEENTINFFDQSFGNPNSWEWTFGDGNTSTEQDPMHTYAATGEYVVSLTIASDSGNCTSYFEDRIFVYNDTIWPNDCQAMFFYYPDSLDLLTQNFIDMSVAGTSNGIPDTWSWDFGDGQTSTEQNPTHTYTEDGVYNVCLTITGQMGDVECESTFCEEVYTINDTITDCFAWYEYQITDLSVDFQAFLEGGNDADYTWDFGDGATGTGATITHTYTENGVYEVVLTATSGNDSLDFCTSTFFDVIWVGDSFSFDINGIVYLEDRDSLTADFANVYLMTFDTVGNGLINVATTQINSDGYYEFEEASIENCVYFVQAELTDQSAFYNEFAPTYHFSALNWENAMPILPFQYGWGSDIYMLGSNSSNTGSGTISGTVSEEYSRELLSNVEVLLLNQNGDVIKYTRTNNDGEFMFSNLSMETYVVYTEIIGIETLPFDVTLNDQNNSTSVNVVVKNGQALLGIDNNSSVFIESVTDIYPNPVTSDASLNITIKETANIKIEVINQYGQSLYENSISLSTGNHKVNIPSSSFAHGMYFVSITANDNVSSVSKFIKLR